MFYDSKLFYYVCVGAIIILFYNFFIFVVVSD